MKFHSSSVKALCSRVTGFLIIFGLSASISGCQWGDQVVSLRQPDQDNFAVFFNDSATVQLSTVAFDSLQTGGATRLLFGRYKDSYFGKVNAVTFAQPQLASAVTVDEKAVYDSIVVTLKYDKYFYGDTTKAMNLKVHALQTDIFSRSSYFNTSTMPYDAVPMGGKTFYPRPTTDTTLTIRLSDVFGKKVFDLAKNNLLNTQDEWYNLLKGIALVPDANYDGAVLGFSWSGASNVQLHYHIVGFDGVTKLSAAFPFKGAFDQILSDKSGTQLVNLVGNSRLSTPSAKTGNTSFIQSGIGLATRVDFPTVKNIKYSRYSVVNRAFLKVYPVNQSVTNYLAAPPILYMFRIDKNNQYYRSSTGYPSALTSLAGVAVQAHLTNDYINNDQYYLFDVSSQVLNLVLSEGSDDEGILILPDKSGARSPNYPELDSEFGRSVTRLAIGDQKSNSKRPSLQIYYTHVTADAK